MNAVEQQILTFPTEVSSQEYVSVDQTTHLSPIAIEFFKKIHCVQNVLETNFLASDAKWTLFVVAALSYRHESRLNPFPPRFIKKGSLCIDKLVAVIDETPKLSLLLEYMMEGKFNEVNVDVVELLHWVLVVRNKYSLRHVEDLDNDKFNFTAIKKPTHIFEIFQPLSTGSEENLRAKNIDMPINSAFYGNKLDCFHYIVDNGSDQSESIRLIPDFEECLALSPPAATWGASACGSWVSCIALCEYFNNPEYVQEVEMLHDDNDSKYTAVVVTKKPLVRFRYLAFYAGRCPDDESDAEETSWILRHKYALAVAATSLIALTTIGVATRNNKMFWKEYVTNKIVSFFNTGI